MPTVELVGDHPGGDPIYRVTYEERNASYDVHATSETDALQKAQAAVDSETQREASRKNPLVSEAVQIAKTFRDAVVAAPNFDQAKTNLESIPI